MSGDTFNPELEDEVSDGADEVQSDDGDAWATARREAVESSDEDEDTIESDLEIDTEDEEALLAGDVSDEDGDETSEEDEPQPDEAAKKASGWDRNPATLPEDLKPVYKDMERHFHETNRLNSAKGRELEAKLAEVNAIHAELQAKVRGGVKEVTEPDGPPPLPTGEGTTQEQYDEALDARIQWFAEQKFRNAIANGEVVTPDKIQELRDTQETNKLMTFVGSQEGYTPELGVRMGELSQQSRAYAEMTLSKEGLVELMKIAGQSLEYEATKAELESLKSTAASGAVKETTHKAAANSRAVSRPGRAPRAQTVDLSRVKGNAEDRADAAKRAFLES